jgi:CheY-like chemotaxis protein
MVKLQPLRILIWHWITLEKELYDLLILDIRMPKMNGFELTRK